MSVAYFRNFSAKIVENMEKDVSLHEFMGL